MGEDKDFDVEKAIEKEKELPCQQRLCRYALQGDVSWRRCRRLFQCENCSFYQSIEDTNGGKLAEPPCTNGNTEKKKENPS